MLSLLRRVAFLAVLMAGLIWSAAPARPARAIQQMDDPPNYPIYLPVVLLGGPNIASCPMQPADNIWNTPVISLTVHISSTQYISATGRTKPFHADFGSGVWDGFPIGIPFNVVGSGQAKSSVIFQYSGESDAGPYPIPASPLIEGNPNGSGDRHLLTVDTSTCRLYELYAAHKVGSQWYAGSGAIFDLNSNALRLNTLTSADAAGLPILPGLARYDEVAAGEIRHALRFTAPATNGTYIWPARHKTSSPFNQNAPPMGQRFRLKASYDISIFSPQARVIARAMQVYGLILADNGSAWYVTGAPDPRWNNDVLHELDRIVGSDFEAVDETGLMMNADSGQANHGVLR
jgi:hypothetical protein